MIKFPITLSELYANSGEAYYITKTHGKEIVQTWFIHGLMDASRKVRSPNIIGDQLVVYDAGQNSIKIEIKRKMCQTGILTKRQIEVLNLFSQGLSALEVSEKMNISIRTVECHRRYIFQRLEVKNMPGAVGVALRNEIIV